MNNIYPNLFIPGAAKSGTSSLHKLLNVHPKICMSSEKEPFFWVRKDFEEYSTKDKQWYLNLFNEKKNALIKGESSTSYMLFPKFMENVKKFPNYENLKFIFLLRNPVDRIYSHYWYLKGLGSESLSLREAVLKDKNIAPNIEHALEEGKYKNYFQYGLYGKWLSRFYKEFHPNQIKIIPFEDFIAHPNKIVNECFTFLEVNELFDLPKIHVNQTVLLKHPKIHKYIALNSNRFLKTLKPTYKFFPKSLKDKLKKINLSNIVIRLTKSDSGYNKISQEDKNWLTDLYMEDFQLLQSQTNLSFHQWSNFNTSK